MNDWRGGEELNANQWAQKKQGGKEQTSINLGMDGIWDGSIEHWHIRQLSNILWYLPHQHHHHITNQ
jgi:hypothetical protein